MRNPCNRVVVATTAALLLLSGATPVAAQGRMRGPQSARSGWSITASPNPRAANGLLKAVSCATTTVCTAVGLYVRKSGRGATLAERRSRGTWTVQSTPNPEGAATSALNGVSCPSRSVCVGVGQFAVASGAQMTLAERWTGRVWRIQPTPNPLGSSSSTLFAVACSATDACTAVGTADSTLLVERWNGVRWRIQSAPAPAGAQFSELNAVSCTAALSCIAVGDYVNSSGTDVSLAEGWDGTSWAVQPTPNPVGTQFFSFLSGVSCTAGGVCEAAGASDTGAYAERWDGTAWSLQPVPAPAGAQFTVLFGVSCAGSGCEAVGGYSDSSGAFVTLGARWNGTAWHAQRTPDPARASANYLGSVSCPVSADCTAVGQGNGDGTPVTLGERWRNGQWRLQAVPSPAGAAENQLNGIACPARDACLAVGTVGPTRGVLSTEALRWNGTRWHRQAVPTVAGGSLNAVACGSRSSCMAVGQSDTGVLTERWNGTRWRILPAPTPQGAAFSGLGGVSCLSPAFCMATGAYSAGTSDSAPAKPLAERWNGKKWTIVPTATPAGAVQTFLGGVSCTSPSACTTTGEQHSGTGIVRSVAERWNGTRWRVQPTPNPSGSQSASLSGVACTGPSVCQAVGSSDQGILAEQWNGTGWHIQPTPNLPGGQLTAVACPAPAACTAVGFTNPGSGGQVIAERWNGAEWRTQPTPPLPAATDISQPAVACPTRHACTAVGGFENDGPGSISLIEQWRAPRNHAAPAAPHASPGVYRGAADCIRTILTAGSTGPATPPVAPRVRTPLPNHLQLTSAVSQTPSCRS